jgi:hypothetical protein
MRGGGITDYAYNSTYLKLQFQNSVVVIYLLRHINLFSKELGFCTAVNQIYKVYHCCFAHIILKIHCAYNIKDP